MPQDDSKNKILAQVNASISPQTQTELNKPLDYPGELSRKDQDFLNLILDLIEKKKIDLYRPTSLLNHAVYDNLNESSKAKAELDAFNFLATIREIKKLHEANLGKTYQMENLVHRMRVTKERLEKISGDIFII